MFESRIARVGLAGFALLALAALAAPLLAPAPPNEQLDPAAARDRPPGTVLERVELADGRNWLVDRAERSGEELLVERLGGSVRLPGAEVLNLSVDGVSEQRRFWLGTDRFGRDLLARLLYGLRLSLAAGLLAAAMTLAAGIGVGALAASLPPWLDAVLMRTVDALMAFPRLFLLLLLSALFKPSIVLLVVLLASLSWMGLARLVRSQMLAVRARPYVEAATALGLPPGQVLWRHVLPNSLAPVLAAGPLLVADVILSESTLSFLGLGVSAPHASLGSIINDGRDNLLDAWWVTVLPGLLLAILVLCLCWLGDSLRDRYDPRLQSAAGDDST